VAEPQGIPVACHPATGDIFHSHQRVSEWVLSELRGFNLPASGSDLRKGNMGTLAKKPSPKRSQNFGVIRFLLGGQIERSKVH
jgi:hypothetical protein